MNQTLTHSSHCDVCSLPHPRLLTHCLSDSFYPSLDGSLSHSFPLSLVVSPTRCPSHSLSRSSPLTQWLSLTLPLSQTLVVTPSDSGCLCLSLVRLSLSHCLFPTRSWSLTHCLSQSLTLSSSPLTRGLSLILSHSASLTLVVSLLLVIPLTHSSTHSPPLFLSLLPSLSH